MKTRFDRIRGIALGVVVALGVSVGVDSFDLSSFDASTGTTSQAVAQEGGRGNRGNWNGGNRQGGGRNILNRGRQGGGRQGGGRQGGGPGGPGGFGGPGGPGNFQMTAENFARLKSSQFADRVKERVGAERWAQWEAGDFSEGDTAAKMAADAQAKENGEAQEPAPDLTPEERADAEARLRSGEVPNFVPDGEAHYSIESEADYYRQAMAKREDVLEVTATAPLRFYARYLIAKYDEDGDGSIEREEWENKLDKAQAVDLDGDWTLTNQEILYYLVRFSKDRTIYNPNPLRVNSQRSNFIVASQEEEEPVLIRPASAEPRRLSKEEAEAEEFINNGFASLANMTDEEVRELFKSDNPAMESVDDDELLDALLTDMDESNVREYVTSPQVVRGVPVWFLARDRNGDGQLTLLEFAPNLSTNLMAQFGRLDKNGDNIITADEVRRANGGN